MCIRDRDGGRAVGLDSFPIDIGQYLEKGIEKEAQMNGEGTGALGAPVSYTHLPHPYG